MKLVDLNLLLYAVNRDAEPHERARRWWEASLSEEEPVGLAWAVLLGFLRISTSGRVMPKPLRPDLAMAIVGEWLAQPPVRIVQPTASHWDLLKQLLQPLGTAGNLTTDAHLAALALEHGATLYSTDSDFQRFAHLKWKNPLGRQAR